jgi:hypothetical protein
MVDREKISFKGKLKSKRNLIRLTGVVLGILGGYIYYITIGCSGGTCPITSNPFMSILWGGLLGYLVADLFNKPQKKETNNNQAEN